jgi:putative oxidoreductase
MATQNQPLQDALTLAGRVLLAWIFLPAGIAKLTGFAGTVGYIASIGLPMPKAGATLALVVEIVCGLGLLLGFHTRIAALVLAAFTFVASFFFHAYWDLPAAQQSIQELLFDKNIGIAGGLLILAAVGAGAWSIDARRLR